MIANDYQYSVCLLRDGGRVLGEVSVDVDFEPALECTTFDGLRRGLLPAEAPSTWRSAIEPVWHPETGNPYVSGFRVRAVADHGEPASEEFPISYFRDAAQSVSGPFVENGQLKSGEIFQYSVKALPRVTEAAGRRKGRFTVEPVESPLPLKTDLPLATFRDGAIAFGDSTAGSNGDAPAFLPKRVLEEVAALTRQAGSSEAGGVLIGYVRRAPQPGPPEVFMEVTAQIPARHALSELTRLTFTSDTWTAVRSAVALRRKEEIMLGWWHSHAFLHETCKNCEKQKNKSCKASASFMSGEDRALHRTVFPRAYSIALVISDSPCSGLQPALFGWRRGAVASRSFYVVHDSAQAGPAEGSHGCEGRDHATE